MENNYFNHCKGCEGCGMSQEDYIEDAFENLLKLDYYLYSQFGINIKDFENIECYLARLQNSFIERDREVRERLEKVCENEIKKASEDLIIENGKLKLKLKEKDKRLKIEIQKKGVWKDLESICAKIEEAMFQQEILSNDCIIIYLNKFEYSEK